MKPSKSHLRVLSCPCVVQKDTTHVGAKALNLSHQAQKGFCGILFGIPPHQKGNIVYVPQNMEYRIFLRCYFL